MTENNKKALLFRLLYILLAVFLFALSAGNLYRVVHSTTDENLFTNPPSYAYFTTEIPAQIINAETQNKKSAAMDTIHVGDLLLAVNDKSIYLTDNGDIPKSYFSGDSVATWKVLKASENRYIKLRVKQKGLPKSYLRQLPPSVYVLEVAKGGASDLAGMRVGDFILTINGETFSSAQEADIILRRAKSGTTTMYEVLRQNHIVTLRVTLARVGIQFATILFWITGFVFFLTGIFLAVKKPLIFPARILGFAFMAVGFVLMVQGLTRDANFDLFAKIRTVTSILCFGFGVAAWSHGSFYFPQKRAEILEKKWIIATLYLLAFLLFLAEIPTLLSIRTYGFSGPMLGKSGQWVGIILFLLLIFFGSMVKFYFRKKRSNEYKRLNRMVKWVTLSAVGMTLLIIFILTRTGHGRQIGFAALPLLFIPLSYLYTIGRYQLLSMDLRVRRNIQYIVVSWLWHAGLMIVLVKILWALPRLRLTIPNIRFTGTSIEILAVPTDPQLHDFIEKIILIFSAIILVFAFVKIAKLVQRLINRFFDQKPYDISKATGELAEIMATKLEMEELALGIVEKLAGIMALKRVGVLFFREQKECCCNNAYGFEAAAWDDFCLKGSDSLVQTLNTYSGESRISTDILEDNIKTEFLRQGFKQIIPIRFKNKLVGAFLIGEKLSESPLNLDDLTFLAAVSKQASIAIENAFLYEELTEKERLKHELNIARRIQMASLPQSTPDVCGLDIAGISIPALEVGGDYFDYLNGADRSFMVIVGDVSGKGTSAALYMSKVQGILRSLFQFDLSPRDLFVKANKLLYQDLEKQSFITAIGAAMDTETQKLTLARAGHLPLYYFESQQQKVKALTPKGLGLGMEKDHKFENELEEMCISYRSDDIFLFVTDGVTEAQKPDGREFGEQKLVDLLLENKAKPANNIRDTIISEVDHFCEDTFQHDDQTVVVVKIK